LVNDAHAAAGDLPQQFVVAEVTHGGRRRLGGRRGGQVAQGGGDTLKALLAGEVLGQFGGQVRVAGQPRGRVGPLARLGGLHVGGCALVRPLLAVHVPPHPLSCSISPSRFTPRRSSPPTADSLRPSARATAATVAPRRCFISTASRWSSGSRARASA